MKKIKTGFFGGAFNPPHNGHLALARAAFVELGLDELWFVPSSRPPHKSIEGLTDAERVFLTRLLAGAFDPEGLTHELSVHFGFLSAGEIREIAESFAKYAAENGKFLKNFRVREDEIRAGKTRERIYTIDTLTGFIMEEPNREFFLLMGADQAQVFDTWREYESLFEKSRVCFFARDGIDTEAIEARFPQMRRIPFEEMNVSSSEIREKCGEKASLSQYMPIANTLLYLKICKKKKQ